MISVLEITHKKNIFLMAHSVEPAPPLGTILGNLGVNTIKFCEEFNTVTKDLPKYFLLQTEILIYENRSYSFKTFAPTSCYLINLLKFEKTVKIKKHDRYHDQIINCIKLKDLLQIALFKFPTKNIMESVKVV